MEAIMRLLKALKKLKVSLHQQERVEKLSIAAFFFFPSTHPGRRQNGGNNAKTSNQ